MLQHPPSVPLTLSPLLALISLFFPDSCVSLFLCQHLPPFLHLQSPSRSLSFSNSISVSCFGRTCWASAKAIMRTVKQRQMNRWERHREKEREKRKRRGDRGGERHEYEVLALLELLTVVHSCMQGHTSPPACCILRSALTSAASVGGTFILGWFLLLVTYSRLRLCSWMHGWLCLIFADR